MMCRQFIFWFSAAILLSNLTSFTYGQTWKELLDQADSLSEALQQDSAIAVGELALRKAETEFGPEDTAVARVLDQLTKYYFCKQNYAKAVPLQKRALAIRQNVLSRDHPTISSSLANLALLYRRLDRYAEVEPLYKRALAISEKAYGSEHGGVALILNNLGAVYEGQGRFAEAESSYQRALVIWEKLHGRQHQYVTMCLANLASLCREQGKYAEAESLLVEVMVIRESIHGPENSWVAHSLNDLAEIYRLQGRITEAEPICRRALAIAEKVQGPEHPHLAKYLHNLADLYCDQGKFTEAEPMLRRALDLKVRAVGRHNYVVASIEDSYSKLLRLRKDGIGALEMAARSSNTVRESFVDNAMVLSEKDALTYSQHWRHSLDNFISCYVELGPDDVQTKNTATDLILATKGQVSDGIFARQKALITETDSTTLTLAESFRLNKSLLAKLFVEGPGDDLEGYQNRVDSLTKLTNDLEADLSRHSASFKRRQDYRNIGVDRITSLLPEKSILVEYLKYDYLQLQPDSVIPHYLAVVLDSESQPVITDLGDATDVDTLVSEYREHMLRVSSQRHMPLKKDQEAYEIIARKLYDAVIRPVEDYLSGKDVVFIAADGGLNLVSYSGLIDDEGRYLIEKFPIHYLSSGRELIRLKDHLTGGQGLLAIGDPDYNATAITRKERPQAAQYASTDGDNYAPRSRRSSCEFFSGMSRLDSLPGSRWEIDSITKSWQTNSDEPVVAYFGSQASEDVFKAEAPGKRVIHLATHGYYISGHCDTLRRTSRQDIGESYIGENPLLQSGLFFAGANLHGEGADSAGIEDGVLTAYEVSAMDLQGTELVVLSACETALGEVKQGEGVYGLRRAFQMAGVRTVVSALWPVPDKQTATIMSELYSTTGESLPTKLRRIQLDRIASLRSQQLADHPYSWGAFIALGDWR